MCRSFTFFALPFNELFHPKFTGATSSPFTPESADLKTGSTTRTACLLTAPLHCRGPNAMVS